MSSEASFSISVSEGRIEVTGSEKFVREQIAEFKDLIKVTAAALGQPATQSAPSDPTEQPSKSPDSSPVGSNPYPNVIALEEEGVKVLKSLPGKNKAEKTRNAALLVLLGRRLMGQESTPTKEIREVCTIHACIDAPNFAKHLKAGKEHFIISGKGASAIAKLSHPGEIKAKELAKELNG